MANWLKLFLRKEILIILLLGCSAAGPIYLLATSLKEFLYRSGVDLSAIGFFSIVFAAYNLKFLWSPFVDSVKIPLLHQNLGQRRSWLLLSQIFLIIFIFILAFIVQNYNLYLIFLMAILVSFASATQDLVIDAYRIEYVTKSDQSLAATGYTYAYRIIGLLTIALVSLIDHANFSWSLIFVLSSFSIWIGIFATIKGDAVTEQELKFNGFKKWFAEFVIAPIQDFVTNHKWYIIFPFIFSFKLCDSFAGVMTLPFIRDIGFSFDEYLAIVKTFGLFALLTGVFAGGLIAKKKGLNLAIWIALIMQIISNFGFYFQSFIGYNKEILYLVIFIENFSGGMGDVILITYLSSLCNKMFSATQYSLLFAFASLSRTIFGSFSGVVAQNYGWENFFIISIIIGLPAIFFLFLINKIDDFRGVKSKNN